jgi:hypothetical protein
MERFVNGVVGLTPNVAMRIIMFECKLGIVKYVVAMLRARLCHVAMEHNVDQIC